MQQKVVGFCAVAATLGFGAWLYHDFSYEPVIGLIISVGTLARNYWPKSTLKYASKRLKGRESFNYSNNNGLFNIGKGELAFETKWSKASGDSIHVYNDPASIKGLALVKGIPVINQISNASSYDFSSRSRTPEEGDIVVFENKFGNFAAVKIIDIKDCTRSDLIDELTFEYVINPSQKSDFT